MTWKRGKEGTSKTHFPRCGRDPASSQPPSFSLSFLALLPCPLPCHLYLCHQYLNELAPGAYGGATPSPPLAGQQVPSPRHSVPHSLPDLHRDLQSLWL